MTIEVVEVGIQILNFEMVISNYLERLPNNNQLNILFEPKAKYQTKENRRTKIKKATKT